MTENELRIAISMRETSASNYLEIRDSLSRDWSVYIEKIFPRIKWLYVPNIGEQVASYLDRWGINAVIFSGGDSLGESPARDKTERIIFNYALSNGYPILGICRGMQVIYSWLGGKIIPTNDEFKLRHVGNKHFIKIKNQTQLVNSYHGLTLDLDYFPLELTPLAHCIEDFTLEAFKGPNILGLMWHPERNENPQEWETELIYDLFKFKS